MTLFYKAQAVGLQVGLYRQTLGPFEWLFSSSTFFRQIGQWSFNKNLTMNFSVSFRRRREKIKQPIK